MRGTRLTVLRAMWLVAVVVCVCTLTMTAASCGQELPDEAAASGQGAPAAEKMEQSEEAQVFEPAGPAAWDSFDPEVELVGREALLDYLNDVRARHDLEPVTWDDNLQKAAEAHADYIRLHKDAIEEADLSIHYEEEGREGFTGSSFVTRCDVANYSGVCFGEVVAFKPTAVGAARSWLESLYHRFPLLDEAAVHVGYAESQTGPVKINVMEVGSHD
jgi:uncharacterized protein YkwD